MCDFRGIHLQAQALLSPQFKSTKEMGGISRHETLKGPAWDPAAMLEGAQYGGPWLGTRWAFLFPVFCFVFSPIVFKFPRNPGPL